MHFSKKSKFFSSLLLFAIISVHGASSARIPRLQRDTANASSKYPGFGPGSIVFLGDSLTDQWRMLGTTIWQEYYESVAVNLGISGYKTTDTIKQIEGGALKDLNPKVVVLMVGGNDLMAGVSAEPVAKNVRTIVDMIRERLPNAQLLLLSLLPADVPATVIEQGMRVNSLVSAYDTSKNDDSGPRRIVQYLDMTHQFGTDDGKPFKELYIPDGIHLSAAGYKVWANTMDPTLTRLLAMN